MEVSNQLQATDSIKNMHQLEEYNFSDVYFKTRVSEQKGHLDGLKKIQQNLQNYEKIDEQAESMVSSIQALEAEYRLLENDFSHIKEKIENSTVPDFITRAINVPNLNLRIALHFSVLPDLGDLTEGDRKVGQAVADISSKLNAHKEPFGKLIEKFNRVDRKLSYDIPQSSDYNMGDIGYFEKLYIIFTHFRNAIKDAQQLQVDKITKLTKLKANVLVAAYTSEIDKINHKKPSYLEIQKLALMYYRTGSCLQELSKTEHVIKKNDQITTPKALVAYLKNKDRLVENNDSAIAKADVLDQETADRLIEGLGNEQRLIFEEMSQFSIKDIRKQLAHVPGYTQGKKKLLKEVDAKGISFDDCMSKLIDDLHLERQRVEREKKEAARKLRAKSVPPVEVIAEVVDVVKDDWQSKVKLKAEMRALISEDKVLNTLVSDGLGMDFVTESIAELRSCFSVENSNVVDDIIKINPSLFILRSQTPMLFQEYVEILQQVADDLITCGVGPLDLSSSERLQNVLIVESEKAENDATQLSENGLEVDPEENLITDLAEYVTYPRLAYGIIRFGFFYRGHYHTNPVPQGMRERLLATAFTKDPHPKHVRKTEKELINQGFLIGDNNSRGTDNLLGLVPSSNFSDLKTKELYQALTDPNTKRLLKGNSIFLDLNAK